VLALDTALFFHRDYLRIQGARSSVILRRS